MVRRATSCVTAYPRLSAAASLKLAIAGNYGYLLCFLSAAQRRGLIEASSAMRSSNRRRSVSAASLKRHDDGKNDSPALGNHLINQAHNTFELPNHETIDPDKDRWGLFS